jgi:hypothetical protein
MVQLVAHPAPLVEDGVPVHDDLVVAARTREDEGIAESRYGQM